MFISCMAWMVGRSSENLTLHDVDLEAPKESGRTTAGYADFLQVSGCKESRSQ